MKDINILSLFGISVEQLEKYEQIDSSIDSVTFLVRKSREDNACPKCGSVSLKIKDYKLKTYQYLSHTGIKVKIIFEHRRYYCPDCNSSFMEKNPFIRNNNYKVSPNKILEVINYLKDGLPISLISKYAFISVSSVNRILDNIVKVKRRAMPEIISIDEFCSFNSDIESKYACMMIDYVRGCIIDILPSRRSDWLNQYLESIPINEINNIKYIVLDMYRPYCDCFKKYNRNITFVIDPFHYISYVTNAIERVRIKVMKKFLVNEPEYKALKKYRKLLLTKYEPDSYQKLKRVQIWGDKRMYDSDILFQVLSIDHDIEEAYYLGHSFLSKLDSLNYESFKKFFALTIERFQNSKLADFRKVGDTFNNWKEEICNSYLLIDNGKRLSNGRIEGRNNKIKTLKKISYGLTNFDHLRKRIFLIFEKNPTK
jgi:transposase